jgi:hydroxymethylpyrimidine/phosphomethylpyrimidine kinase
LSAEPPRRAAQPGSNPVDDAGSDGGALSYAGVAPAFATAFLAPLIVWTIAGHDPSSGAGITADLATFAAHGLFGASVPTALTAQSTLGVRGIEPVRPEFFRVMLDTLAQDLPPRGIKIGMTGSPAVVHELAVFLKRILPSIASNSLIPIVFDPVLRATTGQDLFNESVEVLLAELVGLVTVLTPNFSELARLTGREAASEAEAIIAAEELGRRYPGLTIVATAGDQEHPRDIVRLPSGEVHLIPGEHIPSQSTHGTGCAFSSALLCQLVSGAGVLEAAQRAKGFVEQGIRRAPGIGHGRGPLELFWPLRTTKQEAKSTFAERRMEPWE